jgi:hypothetical protein
LLLCPRRSPHRTITNPPPLTNDQDLHLIVDGQRIDPAKNEGQQRIFRLPAQPGSVHVASRDTVPAELGLVSDPRSLGVALARIERRQGTQSAILEANDPRLEDGFHDEADGALRWTNGYAALPAEPFAQFNGPVEVVLALAGTTSYIDDGRDSEPWSPASTTASPPPRKNLEPRIDAEAA